MRVRLLVLPLAIVLSASTLASASDRPPRDLHQVGDHWTAWNPPVPPAGADVYVIQRGDTLWDLAAKFYSNPYLWPQIWEKNQYILDAHWIYPGDPLEIVGRIKTQENLATVDATATSGGAATGTEEQADTGEEEVDTSDKGDVKEATLSDPVPLASESDIACTGYIGEMDEEFPFRVTGSEAESQNLNPVVYQDQHSKWGSNELFNSRATVKYNLSVGDIIYLDGGSSKGMSPGLLYSAVLPMKAVIHPITSKTFGRYYHYLGRIRVLSVQESGAIAEIVDACDGILVGSKLKLYEQEPVPLGRTSLMRPVNFPPAVEKLKDAPVVLYIQHDLVAIGADHVVQIDRGSADDVTPGDTFTIYRENREGFPPVVIGELAVLAVQKHSSLAKILESRYNVRLGDKLEPK